METANEKSSRHSKITGNFGENLVCYWLSRRGYETAHVDHTGIDLISKRSKSKERLGISVKTRSKISKGKMGHLNIKVSDFKKVEDACLAFGCTPYFAIVSDCNGKISAILISLNRLKKLYPNSNKIIAFSLSDDKAEAYKNMKGVEYIEFNKTHGTW